MSETSLTAVSKRPEPRAASVLAVILASYLMIGVDISIVNIALPTIRVNLGFSAVTLSWVLNAYLLAYGGFLFLGGRAGDVLGRRRTLFAGVAIFTFASAAGGLATSGWWLLAARAVQGLGAALIAPSTMALLTASFPEGEPRNRALSIYTTAASFGIIIGLLLGGVLTGLLSWRWVLYVNVPVGIALLFAIPRSLPETDVREGRLNVPSGALITLATASLVYSLISAAESGIGARRTLLAFGLAVIFAVLFARNERRSSDPLLPVRLFRNRNRIAAYLGLFFIVAGNFGMFFFATQFLQGIMHLTPVQTGIAYLPMAIMVMSSVRIVPRLLKRFTPRSLILVGTPLQAVAMFWLSRLTIGSSYAAGILGPMILCGLATGLCNIPLVSLALSRVDRREAGAASGLTQTMFSVGGSFGLAVLVSVFGIAARTGAAGTPTPALFVFGATHAFLIACVLAALGFVSALLLIRHRTSAEEARPAVDEAGPAVDEVRPAVEEAHKSVVRRYLETLTSGSSDGVREILHPEWVDHTDSDRGAITGALQIVIDRMISEGDHVAVHGTVHRRHDGNDIRSRMMWFVRMQEDKMAELWSVQEPEAGGL